MVCSKELMGWPCVHPAETDDSFTNQTDSFMRHALHLNLDLFLHTSDE